MNTVRWGILGCGNVTEVKSGPALSRVANSSVVAVMRRNTELAEDYARRHHISRWYDNADNLINDLEVNAIYIATPPSSHCDYAMKAMRAGKPVYVEKPMGCSSCECQLMNQMSIELGIPLFVAYYRRALPYFLAVKNYISDGTIGEPRSVSISLLKKPTFADLNSHSETINNWRVDPSISGGGHFHDLASHQFDFLYFLFGPMKMKTVSGISKNQCGLYDADDSVVASFEFESGVMGSGHWCFTVPDSCGEDRTTIIGSTGKIEFSFFAYSPIRLVASGCSQEIDVPFPEHVQQPLIEEVIADLRGGDKCSCTGQSCAIATQIIEAIVSRC